MDTVSYATSDEALTSALTNSANSEALRNKAIGGGVIIGTAGLALAACIWAWGQYKPPVIPPVEVKVKLEDGVVRLADGGVVKMADGTVKMADGTVRMEDGKVTGTVKLDTATLDISKFNTPVPGTPNRTKDGSAIKREVTVFSNVDAGKGVTIVSGWTYASGDSTKPILQYCYRSTEASGASSLRVDLGFNGVINQAARSQVPNLDGLFKKCVWTN